MNAPRADSSAGMKPSYSRRRLILFIFLAFAIHVALIVIFGTKKPVEPRVVKNVPQLQLADSSRETVALQNPALFALPNARDFAFAVRQKIPALPANNFRWTEPPRWLAAPENLGATFNRLMETNHFTALEINLRPASTPSAPSAVTDFSLPKNSTLKISGALAQRKLLHQPALPSLPLNDILPPVRVQALVDVAGNVVSVVLLEPAGNVSADETALALARTVRFARAKSLTLGEMIFYWHTVPIPAAAP